MKPAAKSEATIWGVSDTDPLSVLGRGFPLIEVSENQVFELKKKQPFILKMSFWYLAAPDEAENQERQAMLLEACQAFRPLACTMSVPPSLVERRGTVARVHSILEELSSRSLSAIYFDFGKLGRPSWIEHSRCVGDPLWDQASVTSPLWKIHGWHPERWVRRYSTEEMARLENLAMTHKPKFVILAHSQRVEQFNKWT